MSTRSASWFSIQDFLQENDRQTVDCFHRTQWDELARIASDLVGQLECKVLDQAARGLNNIVRLLEFPDKSHWVARVHIRRGKSPQALANSTKLETEIATMQFIKEHSDLPIPRVFAYEVNEDNPVGAAFILMQLLPGTVAMDALGGHKVHRGVIPKEYRQNFYRSVAKAHVFSPSCHDVVYIMIHYPDLMIGYTIQVQLTSLRLPQIGTIVRNDKGEYKCGPLPGIGGPFDTAAAFFKAWADTVKFKLDKETITKMMKRAPITTEQMIACIENFPAQIKAMASWLSLSNEGPFPLDHDDFLHSNIMVDENNFDVTGIIDWEGACTVPWELIAFPEFLSAMPFSFDLPQKYNKDGQPLDEELRETWRERDEYVEMVKSAELQDDLLSACLGSKRSQAIAYSYGAYTCIGKLGTYDRVIEEIEKFC